MLAESYIECDNRGAFHNAAEFARLYPEDDRPSWVYSAPFIEEEPLAALRERLGRRARALGYATTEDPDLHLLVDGRRLDPERVDGTVHRFALSDGPSEIRLASRAARPFDIGENRDRRRLGIKLHRITLRSASLALAVDFTEPALSEGFHEAESTHRWTDGNALLPPALHAPFTGEFTLEIDADRLAAYPLPGERWLSPDRVVGAYVFE